MTENSPKCLHCSNLITIDVGYSEYTITGALFKCSNDCFKEWKFCDEEDTDMNSLKEISDRCSYYIKGNPEEHHMDCDIMDGKTCNCECTECSFNQ